MEEKLNLAETFALSLTHLATFYKEEDDELEVYESLEKVMSEHERSVGAFQVNLALMSYLTTVTNQSPLEIIEILRKPKV